jgi:hypothetical protein
MPRALRIVHDRKVPVLGDPGDTMRLSVNLDGGHVVRFASSSFYARTRRKLRVTDSAGLA